MREFTRKINNLREQIVFPPPIENTQANVISAAASEVQVIQTSNKDSLFEQLRAE